MEQIQSLDQYFTLVRGDAPVVMVFSAEWCKDCRYMDTFIDEVVSDFASKVSFYKVDRDAYIDLCEQLDILGIPSFLFYHKGNIIGRFVSKDRKTKQEVEGFLNESLARVQA